MSVEFAYRFQNVPPSPLRDLDDVMLTAAVTSDDGDLIPAGTEGTIVNATSGDGFYIVEFSEPEGALATVTALQIRLVTQAAA